MKKYLFLGVLFACAHTLYAQNIVSGKLLDKNSREPLDFANVSISKEGEEVPVSGTTTDLEGEFRISGLENGNYTATFSFIGYSNATKTFSLNGEDVKLGKIYLEEDSKQLEEVEVVGQGSTMRFELDKKVFSVDQNIASAGGNVTDVLENIPSVEVDQEGNISMRNNDAVEIWINGKPSGLTSENRAQILQQMPADAIKEIELITNPSAKFSPEGSAGIINLVLKKDRKPGYYGSVNASIDYPYGAKYPGGRLGGNINLTKGILDTYFNVGYHFRSSNGGTESDRHNFNGTDTIRLTQTAKNDRHGGGMFLRGGFDLRVSDRSTIGVSAFGIVEDTTVAMFSNRENSTNYYTTSRLSQYINDKNYLIGDTLSQYSRNKQSKGGHPGYNVMVDYHLAYNKSHDLLVSAAFSDFQWNGYSTYTQKDATENIESIEYQLSENRDRNVQLKADYTWKPTLQSRLEAGWQTDLSWRTTHSDATDLVSNLQMKEYYNEFLNQEQIHALYITYGNRFWERFSLQVGLRAEYMKRHLNTEYYNELGDTVCMSPDTSYLQFFPSVYLSYSFPNGHELQLNYTRRIDRPRGHQINPRMDFSDATNISYGNPDLLPAFSSSLELNYLKTWEAHTLSAGLYYKFANNVIQNITYLDLMDGVMRNTFVNVGRRHEAGLELVAKNRFWNNILQLTTSVNLFYNRMDSANVVMTLKDTEIPVCITEQQVFAGAVRLNAQVMFTKTFSGQISGRYSSPKVVAQGKRTHNYSIDLGLRKTFLDRKLALAFNARDVLNSRSFSTTTWGDNFWMYQKRRWNSGTISLSLTYSFGNNQKKKNGQERQSQGNDFGGDGDEAASFD